MYNKNIKSNSSYSPSVLCLSANARQVKKRRSDSFMMTIKPSQTVAQDQWYQMFAWWSLLLNWLPCIILAVNNITSVETIFIVKM